MQVNCPNCGAKVTADKINIQKMTAVCTACDTVFSFDLPEAAAKAKRRKVKLPTNLTVRDDDSLQMEFWTNFRLGDNEAFVISTFMGVCATFLGVVMLGSGEIPFIMPFGFLALAAASFYALALTVVNKTHIDMDEHTIRVTRQPIPNPLSHGDEISLAGVVAIKYEETAISKKEAYDLPRYRVWAETADGSRRTIVNDVTEEYAVFIAQRLQERLDINDEVDTSRLEQRAYRLDDRDDEVDFHEVLAASQKPSQH